MPYKSQYAKLNFPFFFILFALFTSSFVKAQVNYEEGYIITDDGAQLNCLIKNEDWRYNPGEVQYRLSTEEDVITGKLSNTSEFSIPGQFKYIRAEVDLDRSSNRTDRLSTQKQATFSKATLFLKVLLEGEFTLLEYRDGILERYFYRDEQGEITPLVYKKYLNEDGMVDNNNRYQQQLYNLLKCQELSQNQFTSLRYEASSLEKLFIQYHECSGYEYITNKQKKKQGEFKLTAIAGVNYNNIEVVNGFQLSNSTTSLDATISPRLGLELEYLLPFNRNKWAVFLQPTLNMYNSEKSKEEAPNQNYDLYIDLTYIETILGFKHFMYFNPEQNMYILAGANLDTYLNTDVYYFTGEGTSPYPSLANGDMSPVMGFSLGLGYSYKKLRLDLLTGIGKKIRGDSYLRGDYDLDFEAKKFMISLNLGYRLL